jgi:polysaccharide biosynthesis/export protein
MKYVKNRNFSFLVIAFLSFLLSSCVNTRRVVYFHDIGDTTQLVIQDSIRSVQALVAPGDLLDIYVSSINSQANSLFNLGNVVASPIGGMGLASGQGTALTGDGGSNSNVARGYRVREDGTIDYPVLGRLPVAGLTLVALEDTLESKLADYLKRQGYHY